MAPWLYNICKLIAKTILHLLTRWQVRGRENVPGQGPVLIVANHLNLADPPLLGVSIRRRVTFMAKEELFRSRLSNYLMCSLGAFPVHRGQLDRKALRQASQVLAEGRALAMFPEGTRSKNTQLQLAYSGSALIALRSDVPILPIGISGTEKMKGAGWLLRRPRITVNIGHPFHLPSANGKLTSAELAKLTNYTMERIAELLPPEYRGNYSGQGG